METKKGKTKMKFHEYLKSLIKKSDIINAELARRMEVHKSYITQLTNRHCNAPSRYRCYQIADALGCNEQERIELLLYAVEDRMSDDELEIFNIFKEEIGDVHSLLQRKLK